MKLRVRYGDPAELVRDADGQFSKGGFLVKVEPTEDCELYTQVELELALGDRRAVVAGQLVQMLTGLGLAVAFETTADVIALIDEARRRGPGGEPAVHERIVEPRKRARAPLEAHQRVKQADSKADKIKLARYGSKDERMQIMRGGDRSLHRFVIQNPGLGLDEVSSIAKMTTLSPEILKMVGERREWAQRPEVAIALVRNPKTPVPLAIKLLAHVSQSDLRMLAKGSSLRMPILRAARKRVLAP